MKTHGQYLVTAIIQDNQENTRKVCARTDDSFDASRAVLMELTDDQFDAAIAEQVQKETWRILSLHVDDVFEMIEFSRAEEVRS